MGQNEQQVSTTVVATGQLLRPSGTVVGVDGVKVVAPHNWQEDKVTGVSITIKRVDIKALPVPFPEPFDPALDLALPVYSVMADVNVFTADRGAFQVRLPIGTLDPKRIAPYVLTTIVTDSDSPGEKRVWKDALGAKVSDGFVQFEIGGFGAGEQILFTALLLSQ